MYSTFIMCLNMFKRLGPAVNAFKTFSLMRKHVKNVWGGIKRLDALQDGRQPTVHSKIAASLHTHVARFAVLDLNRLQAVLRVGRGVAAIFECTVGWRPSWALRACHGDN